MHHADQGYHELVHEQDHDRRFLKPEQLERLFKTHLRGAFVRSGAGVIVWAFTLVAFFYGAIDRNAIEGASAVIACIMLMNIPMLAILSRVKRRLCYEYLSLIVNALEILGYTGFIYFVGGFRSAYLTPIYAAVIFYVGVQAPMRYPFILAGLCSLAFSAMVTLEHFGFLPHQNMFFEYTYRWDTVAFVLCILTAVLFLIALMATYTSRILGSARAKLRENNLALELANRKLKMEIDERIRAEGALYESEQKLHDIFENVPDAIFSHDLEGNFIEANRGFRKFLGYAENAQIPTGLNIRDIMPDKYKPLVDTYLADVIKNTRSEGLISVIRKDGKERVFEYRNSLIRDGKGVSRGVRGSGRDITERLIAERERTKLQEQLQRAQKMEAIGLLAGGVAHDLNNILSGLVSYPELLLIEIPENSPLRKPLITIQRSGEKAASIVQDLLTLARRGVATSEVVKMSQIITEYLNSLEHKRIMEMIQNIKVETCLDPDLMNIMGSPVHLSKTVMNLMNNAAESMPDGGTITISCLNRYIDKPLKGYDTVEKGDYVTLTITDTGTGMTEKDRERIFEPFYTKKAMGRSGTGLGMAVVWGTVKDHHGYIEMQSVPGRGSSFTIYFPSTQQATAQETSTFTIDDYRGNGETILVVDDVRDQREIASKILERLGYQVESVGSGEEAIEYLKQKVPDLLVLDMIMTPGIDGLETYKRILEMNPCQKAVIASGYSETERVKEALQIGARSYIKKPYHLEKIGVAVKEALTG